MENNNQKVIRISRKKLIIALVILVVFGLVIGIILNSLSTARMKSVSSPETGMAFPDYYNDQSDITDTREFLKTSYSATLKTRDVPEMAKEVKNAIRDVEGRIDNINSSEKYGQISFVVPKSRFEEFRSAVES